MFWLADIPSAANVRKVDREVGSALLEAALW